MSECNADLGHPCDANDGEPCHACIEYEKREHDFWFAQWTREGPEERHPEKYRQDMIDAGRGHLLREDER